MFNAVEGVLLLHHDVSSDKDREIDYANYTYGENYALSLENVTPKPICNQQPDMLMP